jgi:hypothetical protein
VPTFAEIVLAATNVTGHARCGTERPLTWCNDPIASNVGATAVAAANGPNHAIDVAWIQSGDIWYAAEHLVVP